MKEWYLYGTDGQQGPYTTEQLKEWLANGSIGADWSVWAEGMAEWTTIGGVAEFAAPPAAAAVAATSLSAADQDAAVAETSTSALENAAAHPRAPWWKRRPQIKPVYVAVLILLLGGGGFAAYQANLFAPENTTVTKASSTPEEKVVAAPEVEEDESEVEEAEAWPEQDPPTPFVGDGKYKARNVVVLVIDGPRYSETWGEKDKKYIQAFMERLVPYGVVFPNFRNEGVTKTMPGHAALITGFYQDVENSGGESPDYPSFLQRWLKKHDAPKTAAWIVASKDKIDKLGNTEDPEWKDQFVPNSDAGKEEGKDSGWYAKYRSDENTWKVLMGVLRRDHPQLLFVNLREPDLAGHLDQWEAYLKGIERSHEYAAELWEYLQADPFYKDKTAFFVTNDHGRHLDDVANGFIQHGDDCEGCRRILLYAAGPDFPEDKIVETPYEQIDLPVTIARILGLEIPGSKGKLIKELVD